MPLFVYDRQRRRIFILKARIHHGLVGLLLLVCGIGLMVNDRHDFPWLQDL